MSEQLAKQLLAAVERQEAVVRATIAAEPSGMMFLTALKVFDLVWMKKLELAGSGTDGHLLRMGLPLLIRAHYGTGHRTDYEGLIFQPTDTMIWAAVGMLHHLGSLETARQFAHLVFAGDCQIEVDESGVYQLSTAENFTWADAAETFLVERQNAVYRQDLSRLLSETEAFRDSVAELPSLLEANVRLFHEHYIAYDAHPKIDNAHFAVAMGRLQATFQLNAIHPSASFGGVQFRTFVLGLAHVIAVATKHVSFCEALQRAHPEVRTVDILTITAEGTEFRDAMLRAVNEYGEPDPDFEGATPADVDVVLQVLSCDWERTDMLRDTMAPVPPLVAFSRRSWIKSCMLPQLDPIAALLTSLRVQFPKDWDRAQQKRERYAQDRLTGMLRALNPAILVRSNTVLRKGRRHLTDVDLTAFDPRDGTLLLFQLKYQDHYAGNMKARTNRVQRLIRQAENWSRIVSDWLNDADAAKLRDTFGLPIRIERQQVSLAIICERFAHHLYQVDLRDASYGSWPHLIEAFAREKRYGTGSLAGFRLWLDRVVDNVIVPQDAMTSEARRYDLGDLSFEISVRSGEASPTSL